MLFVHLMLQAYIFLSVYEISLKRHFRRERERERKRERERTVIETEETSRRLCFRRCIASITYCNAFHLINKTV